MSHNDVIDDSANNDSSYDVIFVDCRWSTVVGRLFPTKMTSYVLYESLISHDDVINDSVSHDSSYDVIFFLIGVVTWPGALNSTFWSFTPTQRLRGCIFKDDAPPGLWIVLFTLVQKKIDFHFVLTPSRTVWELNFQWALENSRKFFWKFRWWNWLKSAYELPTCKVSRWSEHFFTWLSSGFSGQHSSVVWL